MSGDKRVRLKQWLESGEVRLQPLTFPQRELWEASPVEASDVSNHICCLISVRGMITPQDCRMAVQRVLERQEVLRLSFLPGKEQPVQMIRQSGEANLQTRELSSTEARPEGVEEVARELFHRPFDLMQGPLYRVNVLRRAADDHVMVLAIHHAIADGWTLGVFVQDLCAAYLQERMGTPGPLPPVPLSYSVWGAGERTYWKPDELGKRAAFWRNYLSGGRRLLGARGITVKTAPPRRWVTAIPADLGRAARELTRRGGVTLFSTLLTAFQLTMSKWTGEEDVIVGTPVANRSKQAIRETMGYCSSIVPIRAQMDHTRSFAEHLKSTHQATVDCFANAMPFAELSRALGEMPGRGYNPIFDVRFALQNHPVPDVALPGLSAQLRMRSTGTARFDLGCEITENGEALEVAWLFWPEVVPAEEIENLSRMFQTLLATACRSPDAGTITTLK